MTEEISRRLIGGEWVTSPQSESSGGGSTAGAARVLGPFEFAFDTPDLNAGVEFYTPTEGDLLLDAMLFTPVAWNGTTPRFDFGPNVFEPGNTGMFRALQSDTYVGLDLMGADQNFGWVTWGENYGASLTMQRINAYVPGDDLANGGWFLVNAGDPWKLWVSQDGLMGGAAPGGTTGTLKFYLVIATPVLP